MCDHNYRWLNALWWGEWEVKGGLKWQRVKVLWKYHFCWLKYLYGTFFYQWVVLKAILFSGMLMLYSGICVWRDKWNQSNDFFSSFLNRFQCLVNVSKDKHLLMLTTVRLPKLEAALKWCIVLLAVFHVPKLENKQHFLSLQQHETVSLNTSD